MCARFRTLLVLTVKSSVDGSRRWSFQRNPAGISSVLFYRATVIIHGEWWRPASYSNIRSCAHNRLDIFRINRFDIIIADKSSYLDLAPLYGYILEVQMKTRTLRPGLLKPDTFHERRLLEQPVGVNVLLILYSRFHNYVADILLKINENSRVTLPSASDDKALERAKAKQDNDFFQIVRLYVQGFPHLGILRSWLHLELWAGFILTFLCMTIYAES